MFPSSLLNTQMLHLDFQYSGAVGHLFKWFKSRAGCSEDLEHPHLAIWIPSVCYMLFAIDLDELRKKTQRSLSSIIYTGLAPTIQWKNLLQLELSIQGRQVHWPCYLGKSIFPLQKWMPSSDNYQRLATKSKKSFTGRDYWLSHTFSLWSLLHSKCMRAIIIENNRIFKIFWWFKSCNNSQYLPWIAAIEYSVRSWKRYAHTIVRVSS